MTTNLEKYLDDYIKLAEPGYAVLVTGDWGSGKTFQVRKALPSDKYYYVSLFGIQSTEEIHTAVMAAMYPVQSKLDSLINKVSDSVSKVGGVFAFGQLVPGLFSALLRQEIKSDSVIVFDDIERSGLKLGDLLGVINFYVEHCLCPVIVIAHDEKLSKRFRRLKEKIIGHTLNVTPQTDSAFACFIKAISDDVVRANVATHKHIIIETFGNSGIESLRILRHIIADLEKVFAALSQIHIENQEAMTELLTVFCALNIEIRTGGITGPDLRNRSAKITKHLMLRDGENVIEKANLVKASDKYSISTLQSTILNDDVLVNTLVNGVYEPNEIANSLNNSPYFFQPDDTPPWKVVINFDELSDEVVENAVTNLDEQFTKRAVVDSGEMLHMFALKLMMVENKIAPEKLEGTADACIKYVDDLLGSGKLPPRETHWRWEEKFEDAYDGYSYWVSNAAKPHFDRVKKHLIGSRETAFENQFPAIIRDLLLLAKSDGEKFLEQIAYTDDGDNPFAAIPILAEIPCNEFVDAWLSGPIANWRKVSRALFSRYRNGSLRTELESEKIWLRGIIEEIEKRADSTNGFAALRVRRLTMQLERALAS